MDKNNIHEISKKYEIKHLFEEDENLDILICTENNITNYQDAKIKGLSNYSTIKSIKHGGVTFYFRH